MPSSAARQTFEKFPHSVVRAALARGERFAVPVVFAADADTFRQWFPDEPGLSWEEHTEQATELVALFNQRYARQVLVFPALLKDKPFAAWLAARPPYLRVFTEGNFGLPEVNKPAAIRSRFVEEMPDTLTVTAAFQALGVELSKRSTATVRLEVHGAAENIAAWRASLIQAGVKFLTLE